MSYFIPGERAAPSAFMRRDQARLLSLAGVAALHIVGAGVLLMQVPTGQTVREAKAFMVTLLQEDTARQPPKKLELPRAAAAKVEALTFESPPMPPVPNAVTPASIIAEAPPMAPLSAPALAAQSAPIVPPQFDADYLDNPAPVYPAISRRLYEQGHVSLRVLVDAQGMASQLEIHASSGSQRLDSAAMEAVRRWKFVPARQGEKWVASWVVVPIDFSLKA